MRPTKATEIFGNVSTPFGTNVLYKKTQHKTSYFSYRLQSQMPDDGRPKCNLSADTESCTASREEKIEARKI